jgi:hypothetical protein
MLFVYSCLCASTNNRLYPNQAQVQFLENQLHEACELALSLRELPLSARRASLARCLARVARQAPPSHLKLYLPSTRGA